MFSKLFLTNFKGSSREIRFRAGNVILGANFAGKSAVDQALRCVTLGYVPGVAKTSAGIKQFASGYPMRIAADISLEVGPTSVVSVAFDKVKSTIKQTEDNTFSLREEFNEQTKVLFDPSTFFGLADSARITKACELVLTEGGTYKDVDTAVKALLFPVDEDPQQHPLYPAYTRWTAHVSDAATINDILALSETLWKEEKKTLAEERTRQQKSAEALSDANSIDAEIAKLPQRHETEAKKTNLDGEIKKLDETIGAAKAGAEDARRRATERQQLSDLSGLLGSRQEAYTKAAAENTKWQSTRERLAGEISTAQAEHRKAIEERKAANKTTVAAPTPATTERTDDFQAGAKQGVEYDAVCRVRLGEDDCVQLLDVKSWTDVAPAAEQVDNSEAEEAARTHICNLDQSVTEAQEKVASLQSEQAQAKQSADTANWNLQSASNALQESKTASEKIAAEAGKQTTTVVVTGEEEIAKWKASRDLFDTQRTECNTVLENIARFEQDKKRIEDAAKKREELDGQIKTFDSVIKLIAQKKQDVVSGSIEAPLAIANKLADGILKGKLVFQEGEIGMLFEGKFISQRVFSGIEADIVMMGLTAGLANKSKLRVLILDELGNVGPENIGRFMDNLIDMVKDRDIDQFFLIGPNYKEIVDAATERQLRDELKLIEVA